MTGIDLSAIIEALGLPDSAQVDQRVPKKLLLENGAPTSSDKRLVTEAIEEIQWIAALKPNTIGVPDYRDAQREYLEIAVLAATLRDAATPARCSRLAELMHRAVPYPMLLILLEEPAVILSLAHKRWAQNEAGKVVLDDGLIAIAVSATCTSGGSFAAEASAERGIEHAFLQSLAIIRQPQASLYALYQGWMDCIHTLQVARRTGNYLATANPEHAATRRQALADCERLENEISQLRAQAIKEKQLARQVDMNLAIKRIQAELAAAQQRL